MNTESVDEFMKKWKTLDKETDENFDMIQKSCESKAKLGREILKLQSSINDTRKQISTLNEVTIKLTGDLELLKIQFETWRQTWEKANEEYNNMQATLDETQKQIWCHRREYCDEVKDFIENYGIKAIVDNIFKQNIRQQIHTALDDIDINSAGNEAKETTKSDEIIKMETEIRNEREYLSTLERELAEIRKANEQLQQDYESSAESVSLRNALKYSMNETAKKEEELISLQIRLDSLNTKIIDNLFVDNDAEQDVHMADIEHNNVAESEPNPTNNIANTNDFRSAKDVFLSHHNIMNESSRSDGGINKNWTQFPSTSSALQSPYFSGHRDVKIDNNFQRRTNPQPLKNDPYKQIMEMREKNRQQKGKFNLLNNLRK